MMNNMVASKIEQAIAERKRIAITASQHRAIEDFGRKTGTLKIRFGMLPLNGFFRYGKHCIGINGSYVWAAGEYES